MGDGRSRCASSKKELKGFAKVSLAPGETRQVTVKLDRRAFAFYDVRAQLEGRARRFRCVRGAVRSAD